MTEKEKDKELLEKAAELCRKACSKDGWDLSEWIDTIEEPEKLIQQFQEAFPEIIPSALMSRLILKHIRDEWWPDMPIWKEVDLTGGVK